MAVRDVMRCKERFVFSQKFNFLSAVYQVTQPSPLFISVSFSLVVVLSFMKFNFLSAVYQGDSVFAQESVTSIKNKLRYLSCLTWSLAPRRKLQQLTSAQDCGGVPTLASLPSYLLVKHSTKSISVWLVRSLIDSLYATQEEDTQEEKEVKDTVKQVYLK